MSDATQVQLRGGTEAQCEAMTPAEREVVVDVTNDCLRLGDGETLGGISIPNYRQIRTRAFTFAVAAGTANALTATLDPAPGTLVEPFSLVVRAIYTNTAAPTISINGGSALSILKASGGALVPLEAEDIVAGMYMELVYNGSSMIALNLSGASSGGDMELLQVASVSGAASMDFTGLTNEFVNYALFLDDLLTGSSSAQLQARFSVAGSFIAATNTYGGISKSQYKNVSGTGEVLNTSMSQHMVFGANGGFTGRYSGRIDLNLRYGTPATMRWLLGQHSGSFDNYVVHSHGSAGFSTNTSQVDGIRIFPSTGSITGAGRLYGLRKSL